MMCTSQGVLAQSINSSSVQAATPSAGWLDQIIQRNRSNASRPPKQIELTRQERSSDTREDELQVEIRTLHWTGNTLLSDQFLTLAVQQYTAQPLNFSQLQNLTHIIEQIYRDQGYLANVTLPVQVIEQGILSVEILEATLGQIIIQGNVHHVSQKQIDNVLSTAAKEGQPLSLLLSERALTLLSDLSGLDVNWHYVKGAQRSQTDLEVDLADSPPIQASVCVDDFGARSTGVNRLSPTLNWLAPLRLGDAMSLELIDSEGSQYSSLGYKLPIGTLLSDSGPFGGLLLGFHLTNLRYDVQALDLAALEPNGSLMGSQIELSYPLMRSQNKNLTITQSFESKVFNNQNISSTNNYRINEFSFTSKYLSTKPDSRGDFIQSSIALSQGLLRPTSNPVDDLALLPPATVSSGAVGSFSKVYYAFQTEHFVTDQISITGQVQGQEASKNLDSSEKMYLGGVYSVRAYPVGEGGGTRGEMINTELRLHIDHALMFGGFYDWGLIKQNKFNDSSSLEGSGTLSSVNTYALSGLGALLNYDLDQTYSFKATVAKRIGSNPNPTAAGTDQDGSLSKTRLWLAVNALL